MLLIGDRPELAIGQERLFCNFVGGRSQVAVSGSSLFRPALSVYASTLQ
jgi:hypothetical protein